MSRWDSKPYNHPAKRVLAKPYANWHLWVMPDGADGKIIIASEQQYSTIYSRLLRLGDLVVSAGEPGDGRYVPRKGTRGVLLEILWPYTKGVTDYVFNVAFENKGVVTVKNSHLVWQTYQRIKIGQPRWRQV